MWFLCSTTKVVLLVYLASPEDVCDTVLRWNMCTACDRSSGTSKTNEITDRSFSTFWWLKSNRFWCHQPERTGIYEIMTGLWQNMKPSWLPDLIYKSYRHAWFFGWIYGWNYICKSTWVHAWLFSDTILQRVFHFWYDQLQNSMECLCDFCACWLKPYGHYPK